MKVITIRSDPGDLRRLQKGADLYVERVRADLLGHGGTDRELRRAIKLRDQLEEWCDMLPGDF